MSAVSMTEDVEHIVLNHASIQSAIAGPKDWPVSGFRRRADTHTIYNCDQNASNPNAPSAYNTIRNSSLKRIG